MKPLSRLAILLMSSALIASCGQKESASPEAEATDVAAAPTPSPTPSVEPVKLSWCDLAYKAATGDPRGVLDASMACSTDGASMTFTSEEAIVDLTINAVATGDVFEPTAEDISPAAVWNDELSAWTNFGALFAATADDASSLCLEFSNISPDGTTNSIFIGMPEDEELTSVGLTIDESGAPANTLARRVIAQPGETANLAVIPREAGSAIQSVHFVNCEG